MKRPVAQLAVLISGTGSNLQAIIDAIAHYHLPAKIVAVISSRPDVLGLRRAIAANIPALVLSPKDYASREDFDLTLASYLEDYAPDLILLAGFMVILGNKFLARFTDKILNIHPSLLPLFPGLNTHEQAIANSLLEHGCSIHFVTKDLDAGPLIAQAAVKIQRKDTPSSLQAKVHRAEHFLYPTVLQWFIQGRIALIANHVFMDNIPVPIEGLRFKIT